MTHSIIVRYAELGIKGKNRQYFENRLVENIRFHLSPLGENTIKKRWGHLEVKSTGRPDVLIEILKKIPGIANFSSVVYANLSLESLKNVAQTVVEAKLRDASQSPIPFRVSAKRVNKDFPMSSMALESQIGASLRQHFPHLQVQLQNPTLNVGIEIWENRGVVYTEKIQGLGGLPVNERERVIALISGGIDSPVASWMVMKRGVQVIFLYFHSFPFIGEQTKEKVMDLVKHLSVYQPKSRLYVAPFAEIQKTIKADTPEKLRTILYRRFMNRIANRIAQKEKAKALVTGDALSQVASQTLSNLICTTENADYPVLRPLIGMDKNEIMAQSRIIGTYPISIQDFPDCCTVFQPQRPTTKAFPPDVYKAEATMADSEMLVNQAVEGCEIYDYSCIDHQALALSSVE